MAASTIPILLDSRFFTLSFTRPHFILQTGAFKCHVLNGKSPEFLLRSQQMRIDKERLNAIGLKINAMVASAQNQPDKKIEQFDRWLQDMGHDKCNLKLERWPRGSTAPGYGIVAGSGGVEKGQVIVKVPQQAFMTEETALKCTHIGPLIRRAEMTPWQAMCLHLLCERARGVQSPWYPYIALLPRELEMAGLHPLLWPQGLRKEWLAGSPMLLKTESRLHQCREDHKVMLAAGASQLIPAGAGSGAFVTEAAVRWAAAILLSRAFSLNLEEQETHFWSDNGPSIALVPWADMLNHSSRAGKESCLGYDSSSRVASLSAHISYMQGEQVFDSYGPSLSAAQLLVDYGFVDEENQNHAIDLPATVLGPTKCRANEALLNAIGLPAGGAVFSITQSGVDESVLAWTRVAVASLKELTDAGWREGAHSNSWVYNRAFSSMAHFHQPVSRENESEVLRRLLWACEELLSRYPTTVEEDIAMLTSSDGDGRKVIPLPWARKQALRACMSEKLALHGAWQTIWNILKRLRSGIPLTALYTNE